MSLLPDVLETLQPKEKRDVLALLTLVCAADGELVREEMVALETRMGQSLMHPEVRREIRQMLRQPPDLDILIEGMTEGSLKLALRDAVMIAAADGDYHPRELEVIKNVAKTAGMGPEVIGELIDWVGEMWRLEARGRALVGMPLPRDESILERG